MKIYLRISLLAAMAIVFCGAMHGQDVQSLIEEMNVRHIGPGAMSGRVTTIDVQRNRPEVIYIGTASGGLWRSESGGV